MSLLGNYSVLNKTPGRSLSGSTVSDTRVEQGKAGAQRGRFAGWGAWSSMSAVPYGARPPYTPILPIDTGALASYTDSVGTTTSTAVLAGGRNGEATSTGDSTTTATGQLIASGTATSTGDSATTAVVAGALSGIATTTGTSSTAALLGAVASLTATATGTTTATAVLDGPGYLTSSVTPFSELSPEGLAASLWGTLAAGHTAGTMGEAIAAAHILLRNKTITDPAAGTITVYDTDGTSVLYTADLYEDAAGTQAYRGGGAERRDRLT